MSVVLEHWTYDFADEGDAHAFREGVREDLAGEEDFDYVDSEVYYSESISKWVLRVSVTRRAPEAA